MTVVKAGEAYRFEQEVWFDDHRFGTDLSFSRGGQIEIRRGSDGLYWNGTIFVSAQTWNVTTTAVSFHYYDFTIPSTAVDGDTYIVRMRITGDSLTEDVFNLLVRTGAAKIFDGVDFATGFPSTVKP